MSDCSGTSSQNGPVRVAAGSSSNSMSAAAPTRVPSPSPNDNSTPIAENWCYTQVSEFENGFYQYSSGKIIREVLSRRKIHVGGVI